MRCAWAEELQPRFSFSGLGVWIGLTSPSLLTMSKGRVRLATVGSVAIASKWYFLRYLPWRSGHCECQQMRPLVILSGEMRPPTAEGIADLAARRPCSASGAVAGPTSPCHVLHVALKIVQSLAAIVPRFGGWG